MNEDDTHDQRFHRRYQAALAAVLILFACGYLLAITFGAIPKDNIRFADTALGFVLGTMVAIPIGFYFGSSKTAALAPPAPQPPAAAPAPAIESKDTP